jgi:DNA polymerase III epsilon subunit-like protein
MDSFGLRAWPLLCLLWVTPIAALPPFVTSTETAPVASTSPAEDPESWLLAFIDVETTGLVPGWHEMIDIGVVMTELDGSELEALHLRIQPAHPERISDGARRVNAFNSQFDAAFLDHLFRQVDGSWRELFHYFVLDVPSMAWAQGLRGLSGAALATELGVGDEPRVAEEHTGLTGARLNARIYRALEARRANAGGSQSR